MDAVRLSPETVMVEWYESNYKYADHMLTLRGRIDGEENVDSHPWLVLHAELSGGSVGWGLRLRTGPEVKRHELTLGEVLHLLPESLWDRAIESHFALVHRLREEVDVWIFRAERVAMNSRKQIDRCGDMLHDAARLRREAMDVRSEAGKPREGESGMMVNGELYRKMEKGIRSTKPSF